MAKKTYEGNVIDIAASVKAPGKGPEVERNARINMSCDVHLSTGSHTGRRPDVEFQVREGYEYGTISLNVRAADWPVVSLYLNRDQLAALGQCIDQYLGIHQADQDPALAQAINEVVREE